MKNEPKQDRSKDSANRMLEAGYALLLEGGPSSLTIEKLIQRAETSMGSFYARFGDRKGLLVALHNRFLESMDQEIRNFNPPRPTLGLNEDLNSFVSSLLNLTIANRSELNFFMVMHSSDNDMRADGRLRTEALGQILHQVIEAHKDEIGIEDTQGAVETCFRILYGIFLEIVVFDEWNIVGNRANSRNLEQSCSQVLMSYLVGLRSEKRDG